MNYEFHVGDYVEDVDGRVGYISKICTCEKCKERGWYEPSIRYTDGTEDYISNYDVDGIPNFYKRIGAYDFTKKEKKKIEPISECNRDIFANAIKPENHLARMVSNEIIDKINELVDTVNGLRDDYDDHLRAHRQNER